MTSQLPIGIIGCGSIASVLAANQNSFRVASAYDTDENQLRRYADRFSADAYTDFSRFLASPVSVVVEAASPSAAKMYAEDVLLAGKSLLIMSVGALADTEFCERLVSLARVTGTKIYVPSGAILGLDGFSAGKLAHVDVLKLRTTKPPASLGLSPDADRQCIFAGKASECIRRYPKNTNVGVSLSLAGGRDADVELWADSSVVRNTHEIFFSGAFGDAYVRVENRPLPENPATSYLAALSALSILESLNSPLVIG